MVSLGMRCFLSYGPTKGESSRRGRFPPDSTPLVMGNPTGISLPSRAGSGERPLSASRDVGRFFFSLHHHPRPPAGGALLDDQLGGLHVAALDDLLATQRHRRRLQTNEVRIVHLLLLSAPGGVDCAEVRIVIDPLTNRGTRDAGILGSILQRSALLVHQPFQ